jgi:hypothetical protein
MSCTNCGNLGSNCSCSDNCPNKVSDITVFDCNTFNVLEVPCDATLCDVLGLLEQYTTNMVTELDTMTSVVIGVGNCIGLDAGTYGIQQVIDAILVKLCEIPACPLHALISLNQDGTLTVNASGGVGPYTYQWSIADNVVGIEIDGSSTTDTVTIIDGGSPVSRSGLVKVVVTDDNGCSVNDVFLYFVPIVD